MKLKGISKRDYVYFLNVSTNNRKKEFCWFNVVEVLFNCIIKVFNVWISDEICIKIEEKSLP